MSAQYQGCYQFSASENFDERASASCPLFSFRFFFTPFHKTMQNGAGYKKVSFTPKLHRKNDFAGVGI